ncbi:MAG: hypothetical protein L3J66_13000 [Bacteroidales bacterium]|nr:hypothetical protein [Bacteroidales bacterium]
MKEARWKYIYIAIILLVSIRFYSFVLIPNSINQVLISFGLLSILFLNIITTQKKIQVQKLFNREVIFLILLPIFSIIGSVFYHDQSVFQSFMALLFIYMWLFYFTLHNLQPNPYKIIKIVVAMGIIWSAINIIQQFTFPNLLFLRSVVVDENFVLMTARGGVLRLGFMDQRFAVFSAIYFWFLILNKKSNVIIWIFFSLSVTAIFFTGTRQLIASLILTIVLAVLTVYKINSRQFIRVFILGSLVITLIFIFGMDFLTGLIELSEKQQVGTSDFQRAIEMKFFFNEFWPSKTSVVQYFIGNGWEYPLSGYGKEISNLREFKLSRGDVGLIGAFSKGGIVYLFVILLVFFRIFKTRVGNQDYFIKFFFLQLFMTSWTGQNFFDYLPATMLIIISLYYLEYANQNFDTNSNTQPLTNH